MRRSFCRGRARLAWLGLAAGLVACGTLSVPEERQLGEDVNRQVRNEVDLVKDDVIAGYVRDIGRRIVAASGPQAFDFEFQVVDDEAINAFALPAGYIYVNTGVLLEAENVAEVAGVVAHEVGHVVERHVAENYRRQQGVGILYQLGVLTAAILGGGAAASAVNVGGGLAAMAYLNQFGREAEREADAFAVRVMPAAGYDPRGLVTFFETLMEETGGAGPPEFLSSHPATQERIQNTRAQIAASNPPPGLRVRDNGKLEIIQRRIRLLSGG